MSNSGASGLLAEQPIPAARIVFSDRDRAEIAALIDDALATGALTLGPCTRQFEQDFAARHGSPYAVATSSGTAALEIILRSLGVEGSEVVVPTNTFFATAAAVCHAGATPRLADVASDTLALSVETLEAAVGRSPAPCSGVVLVHIGGTVAPQTEAIREWCHERDMFLVEDAAHAHGAAYLGRSAGTFGVASAFSFYPTKVVTAAEGGMILTSDERLVEEALIYRDQGKAGFLDNEHVRLGAAWRMSELHAAVGLVQLRRLDEFVERRRAVARYYDAELVGIGGIAPVVPPRGCEPNYYKYVALLAPGIDRAALKTRLRAEHGVSLSGEVYATPLHRQPIFAGLDPGPLPVAEDLCARHICLPVHSDMTDAEAARVVEALATALAGEARA